ncbi:AAA family ATPase [Actinopolymorpha sp. NPDC004070]|uniref:phosphotransferase-like protein n=1 Tax=Actinopolymorpha sp. NPDC004070 TaxID=3154548 RepID=UPI0033AFC592
MVPQREPLEIPEPAEVPRVIVVTGIMAAGKSTVAQLLAERLDRSAHVRGDVFRRMIVSGSAPIVPGGGEAMDAELRLRYRISASVADAYAAAGYTAVVQDIIIGRHLPEYVKSLVSRPVGVVVLAPGPDVVERRESGRTKTGYADGWSAAELDAALRVETPRIGLWLDTSDQTPEQTVTQILQRLPETRVD